MIATDTDISDICFYFDSVIEQQSALSDRNVYVDFEADSVLGGVNYSKECKKYRATIFTEQ